METLLVDVVGGGLAEWPSATGPRGETIAPCAFVDASAAPDLLALPALFQADPHGWQAVGHWSNAEDGSRLLVLELTAPRTRVVTLVFRGPRQAPFIAAVERAGTLYICPTTPAQGVNARLARDASFAAVVVRREP